VITISPVHWLADCCLATSYKHSSYCCVTLSEKVFIAPFPSYTRYNIIIKCAIYRFKFYIHLCEITFFLLVQCYFPYCGYPRYHSLSAWTCWSPSDGAYPCSSSVVNFSACLFPSSSSPLLKTELFVGFQTLMAVNMKSTVFWVLTPCSSESPQRFGGKYHLSLQG
jgi:hypothetical protein